MNHLKSRPRVKKRYGRGCFSSFALSLPDNPHDYCIPFPPCSNFGTGVFFNSVRKNFTRQRGQAVIKWSRAQHGAHARAGDFSQL